MPRYLCICILVSNGILWRRVWQPFAVNNLSTNLLVVTDCAVLPYMSCRWPGHPHALLRLLVQPIPQHGDDITSSHRRAHARPLAHVREVLPPPSSLGSPARSQIPWRAWQGMHLVSIRSGRTLRAFAGLNVRLSVHRMCSYAVRCIKAETGNPSCPVSHARP